MKILHAICSVSLCIIFVQLIDRTEAGSIDSWVKCESNADCVVPYTVCDILGCEGRVCQCPGNMTMDKSGNTCKITKTIGESCDEQTDICVFIGSICRNGRCECQKDMKQDTEFDCIPSARTIFGTIVYQPYGAMCDQTNRCAYRDFGCINGKCNCTEGYRHATLEEVNAMPNLDARCRAEGFMLHTWNPELCGQTDLKIGEQCGIDSMYKCPANSTCVWKDCNTQMCVCDENFVVESTRATCLPPKRFGEACSANEQCVDYGTFCVDSQCKCHTVYKEVQGSCELDIAPFKVAHHGENCTTFSPLQDYVPCVGGSSCIKGANDDLGICGCTDGRVVNSAAYRRYKIISSHFECVHEGKWFLTSEEYNTQCAVTTTPEIPRVGRNCTIDNMCPNNSECITYSCSKKCVCLAGYTESSDSTHCVQASGIDSFCAASENCDFQYSECASGQCLCEALTVRTEDNQCRKNNEGPTGSECTQNSDCFGFMFQGQVCSNSKCVCNPATMRDMSPLEVRSLPKDKKGYRCISKSTPQAEASCDPTAAPTTTMTQPATTTTPTTTTPTTTTPTTTTPTTTTIPTTTTPTTPYMVNIDDTCDVMRFCPPDATCTLTFGGQNSVCQCDIPYAANLAKTGCIRVAFFGDACDSNTKCAGAEATCVNGKCYCDTNGLPADKMYCLGVYPPYLEYKSTLNMENGDTDTRQCLGPNSKAPCLPKAHLECTNSVCGCASGYRDAVAQDRIAAPTERVYCVNSSWPHGYRPPPGSPESVALGLVEEEESLENIIRDIKTKIADEERQKKMENSKLIIAACISAVGVFAVIVFLAIITRKVIRKRHQKTVATDTFDSS